VRRRAIVPLRFTIAPAGGGMASEAFVIDWNAVGAVGDAVGAIGVIVTLIYLALQIRQNTSTLKAAAKHEATSRQLEYFDILLLNPELRRVYRAGLADFHALNPDERDLFGMLMYRAFLTFSEAYYEYRHAHFDKEQWLESSEAVDWHLTHPGARDWWSHPKRREFPVEFVDLVASRIEKLDAA